MTVSANGAIAERPELYIGLMSGTSLDGVDAVLAEFSGARPVVIAADYSAFTPELRAALQALQAPGPDELHRAAMAANALVDVYAATVAEVLARAAVKPAAVTAIGAHGQTVRHRPGDGYTLQINNPARLAEATGIAVVADFRSRDVAAGGQGAPLVPAFHAALFQHPQKHRAVVNIGGIANITNLPAGSEGIGVTGWDTGPGNVLLDLWCERHQGAPFDEDGRWAAQGNVDASLLQRMLAEPYLAAQPPKSTGRDLFNAGWLESKLEPSLQAVDVQATLLELTATTIAQGIARHCSAVAEVLVCGGGACNGTLMRRLAECMAADERIKSAPTVQPTDDYGVRANLVEAMAFAWLARQTLHDAPGNLPAVTGARGRRILGAVYPA